jgi:hypothetical protein
MVGLGEILVTILHACIHWCLLDPTSYPDFGLYVQGRIEDYSVILLILGFTFYYLISLVCSFAIFQARNDPVWFSPRLVT